MFSLLLFSFSDSVYENKKQSLRLRACFGVCFLFLMLTLSSLWGQDRSALHQKLEKSSRTEEKIELLLALARIDSVSDSAFFYAKKAEVLANNQKNREKQAEALALLAAYYDAQHNLVESLKYYQEAILAYTRLDKLEPQIRLQIALSKIFEQSGDKSNALETALSALKNAEKLGKPALLRHAYMQVGIAYSEINENKKAEREVLNALAIDSVQRDSLQMAYSYNVLGTIAQAEKDYKKAFYFYMKSKEFYQSINDVKDLRIVLSSIGELLILQMNYNEALQYLTESYNIDEQFADIEGMAYNLAFIAEVYYKKRNYERAIEFSEKSLGYALNTKSKQIVLKNYQLLSLFYEAKQDLAKALSYERKYSDLRNEIFEKNNADRLAEAQTLHQLDKKQKEIELYEKNAELATEQARNTRYLNYFMIASALGAIFYGFLFYRRYREKAKANVLLQEQKAQIEAKNHELEQLNEAINHQRAELEQTNEEMRVTNTALDVANSQLNIAYQQVTSSIMYAKRIQDAMLPAIDKIKRLFPNSFILYQPRDIVSGDFYWFSETGDKIVLVVADCTGHGVPGAFMSMLGDAFLNLIINQQGKTKPDEILNLLHQNIYTALHQADRENQDGMDAAILTIDKKQRILHFAGARLPLVYKKGNHFQEIKGDKMPIGGYRKQASQTFRAHTIPIDAPLTLYLYSDGFQDQFGGELGRKFMSRRFKDLLQEIHYKSMPKQEEMLNVAFQKWTGLKYKQIDDILVVGLKFSPQDFFQEPDIQTLASSGNPYE